MENKEHLLDEFSKLISFVSQLRQLDNNKWSTSIEEGKWSIRDIVAHIALWDNFFLDEVLQKIINGQKVEFELPNYEEFNQNAIEVAKGKSQLDIIDMTITNRKEIIRILSSLSKEEFSKEHNDSGNYPLSPYSYVTTFISHDSHHMNQMKDFLNKEQL